MSSADIPRIAVCIITYRRPASLATTLDSLRNVRKPDNADICVRIIDNDAEKSAFQTAAEYTKQFPFPLTYHHEPRKGIPHARNKALDVSAKDAYIAFIDDDDTAAEDWLSQLFATATATQAEVAKGLIQYHFDETHAHIRDLGIFSNPPQQTGEPLDSAWTNNVLFTTAFVQQHHLRFHSAFLTTGGSDNHFFRCAKRAGANIVMCREAVVHTHVPQHRTTTKWLAMRHTRVGATITMSDILLNGFSASVKPAAKDAYDATKHACVLLREAARGHIRWLLPFMSLCFAFGRISGLLRLSPREYK